MTREWTEGTCGETSGFLFRHECFQLPQNRCAVCNKPICEEHTQTVDGRTLCPACAQAEARAAGQTADQRGGHYYGDPYYHSHTYYYGYGDYGSSHRGRAHADPNDLQAGDAESLRNEGDEDFENDMSES